MLCKSNITYTLSVLKGGYQVCMTSLENVVFFRLQTHLLVTVNTYLDLDHRSNWLDHHTLSITRKKGDLMRNLKGVLFFDLRVGRLE